jgi:hypothetical protein
MRIIVLTAAILILCSGCGLNDKSMEASQGFVTIPITSNNSYGGGFYAGILMVSHATGSISVCWKTCTVIGQTKPSGPQDLVLSGGRMEVHVANVATGHVVSCSIDTDEFVTEFKGGHCNEVGTASR